MVANRLGFPRRGVFVVAKDSAGTEVIGVVASLGKVTVLDDNGRKTTQVEHDAPFVEFHQIVTSGPNQGDHAATVHNVPFENIRIATWDEIKGIVSARNKEDFSLLLASKMGYELSAEDAAKIPALKDAEAKRIAHEQAVNGSEKAQALFAQQAKEQDELAARHQAQRVALFTPTAAPDGGA